MKPDPINAEPLIPVTESGSSSVCRTEQCWKRKSGIFVRCDGASNVTDDNPEQYEKAESPRVKPEEGTVNAR
jgi:hypothetical protein